MSELETIISNKSLPADLSWFEVGNQTVFPVYHADGRPEFAYMSILYCREGICDMEGSSLGAGFHSRGTAKWFGIQFSPKETSEEWLARIDQAILILEKA